MLFAEIKLQLRLGNIVDAILGLRSPFLAKLQQVPAVTCCVPVFTLGVKIKFMQGKVGFNDGPAPPHMGFL